MKSGLRPTPTDHRDFDYVKSFGNALPPRFPENYSVENGLWVPDQNEANVTPSFTVQPQPYGCTNFTCADIAADDDGKLYDPTVQENITHANAKGGCDMRTAVDASRKAYGRTRYFNVKPSGIIDPFDAVRLAMYSASNDEKRSVAVGSPWFYQFTSAGRDGVVPVPDTFDTRYATWHAWKIAGWKTINGQPYLISKSWQGENVGDNGFLYFSRPLFNSIMAISGSVAYTMTNMPIDQVETIDVNVVQLIVSLIRQFFRLSSNSPALPPISPVDTPTAPKPTVPQEPLAASKLEAFCTAIRDFEGKPGDLNYKNNNPGNCRCSQVGYDAMYGKVKCINNFAVFLTYELGWLYLNNLVKGRVRNHKDWDFYKFFRVWAPTSDNNQPDHYAEVIAKRMDVPPTTKLSSILL